MILLYFVGILAGLRPCGVIVMLSELFTSESISQVYAYLHEFLRNNYSVSSKLGKYGIHCIYQFDCTTFHYLEFICYDDGCHLRRYARLTSRKDLTATTKHLAQVEILVDKLHMRGHTDPWCKANCDASAFPELDKVRTMNNISAIYVHLILTQVDTEICEQCFSWLSKYAHITRRMKQSTFLFFLLYLCILHNEREIKKLKNSGYL